MPCVIFLCISYKKPNSEECQKGIIFSDFDTTHSFTLKLFLPLKYHKLPEKVNSKPFSGSSSNEKVTKICDIKFVFPRFFSF